MHVNVYHLDTGNWFSLVEQWTEEKAWSGRSLAWLTRIRLEFIMRLTEINDVHDRQEKVRRLNFGLIETTLSGFPTNWKRLNVQVPRKRVLGPVYISFSLFNFL